MTSMADHPSVAGETGRGIYKGLHVGDTGTGKTGAMAALVDAGYKLRILDFDAGLDPLTGYAKKRANLLANVDYETLKDQFKLQNASLIIKRAPSFQRAMALLEKWGDYGPVESWGDDTILVIDTLGSMAKAAFNMVLQANGIIGIAKGNIEQAHWGMAQENVERLLENLMEPKLVPCHVIVNAHWAWQESGGAGLMKPYPEVLGKALNPKVGRKFNNMLGFTIAAGNRVIRTQKDGMIALKTSKPLKPEYPIATGLADIFKEIVGTPPSGGTSS